MKITTLATFICLWPALLLSAENDGQINRIKSGVYQLSYPGQSMHLFFNYLPDNGEGNMFAEIELSDNQQYEIIYILKQFIDQLPEAFIKRYLDIEIFLLRIQNETGYGFTIGDQVVVEISKMRRGSSFAHSIQSSFAHELAHIVEKDPEVKSGASAMRNYLANIRSTYEGQNSRSTNIYDQGYVSRYASGELIKGYNSSEEFAEIFAHLLCAESRSSLFRYMERENGSILHVKMDRYIRFLEFNIPSLGEEFLNKEGDRQAAVLSTYESMDGASLLQSHEQKSYEAMRSEHIEELEDPIPMIEDDALFSRDQALSYKDYDAMYPENNATIGDEDMADLEEELARLDAQITPPEETEQQEYTVYRNSPSTDDYSENEPPKESKKDKKKNKKRKKGTSWLLIGTAVYVALQMMK